MRQSSVIHIRDANSADVYIGRPSKWGNPFEIGRDGNRDQVISKYRLWVARQPDLMRDLHELKGRRLACYCAPKKCHGDVLIELLSNRLF